MSRKIGIIAVLILAAIIGGVWWWQKSPNPPMQTIGGVGQHEQRLSKYTTDGMRVYYDGKPIDADPQTIEVLRGSLKDMKMEIVYEYARDSQNVFYEGKTLKGALPENFRPIENGRGSHYYGTDGKTVYSGSEQIVGADPKSFEILWETIYEGCRKTLYSKDSSRVYFKTTVVSGADAKTFESLINDYGKDRRGYYKNATYIGPNLDPKELVCDYG